MMRNLRLHATLALILSVFPCGATQAQTVPSTAEPGIVSRGLEQERLLPPKTEDILVIEAEKPQGEPLKGEKAFTLQKVILDGSTLYGTSVVDEVGQRFVGKEVSFEDLNVLSRLLTRKYRNDGYIFSRVIIPPQKIKDGVVHMTAIEGRLTEIEITGDVKDRLGLIKEYANKISTMGPANEKDVERYLLLINDLPGISARSYVTPASTPEGGKLTIAVEEKRFEGALGADNRGTRYLGPYRGTIIAAANNLLGIHDRTTVRGISSHTIGELVFGEITHEEQVGTEGLRVKGRYAKTQTRPGEELAPLDVKGNSDTVNFDLLYPLLRGRRTNLNLTGGFELINSHSDILGVPFSNDRVRTLNAGGHFDYADRWAGITQVEMKLVKGIAVLDATEDGLNRSRSNGKHEFWDGQFSATRVQDLSNDFSAQLALTGQYSGDPLLASQEFTVGGPDFGRGHDFGEITGDSGIAGSFEVRYGKPVSMPVVQSFQVYTYYDAGKIWNVDTIVDENKTDSLSSVGGGVRFNLDYGITGSFEVAKPLTHEVSAEGDKDPRVFFNVLKRF